MSSENKTFVFQARQEEKKNKKIGERTELKLKESLREEGKRSGRLGAGTGWRASEAKLAFHCQLTCSLCRPCTSLHTQHRVSHPHGAGSAGQREARKKGRESQI